MKILGLQKLTLVDYPEKLACTIFLFGCNFRCGFCYNPELVLKEQGKEISQEEILEFLKERKKYLDGVCICGGEPLLSLDESFLRKIKSLGYLIKIDTNGSHPERLQSLINLGLVDYVAMDIKGSKEKYSKLIGVDFDLMKLEKSMRIISGLKDYEFRTTIIEGVHDKEELEKIGTWVNNVLGKRAKKFCLQGFKNNGKFVGEGFDLKNDTSENFLKRLKEVVVGYFENVVVRV